MRLLIIKYFIIIFCTLLTPSLGGCWIGGAWQSVKDWWYEKDYKSAKKKYKNIKIAIENNNTNNISNKIKSLEGSSEHYEKINLLLGSIYLNKKIGPTNNQKGIKHLKYAADDGIPEAQYKYAKILINKNKNNNEALEYMNESAYNGNAYAKSFLAFKALENNNSGQLIKYLKQPNKINTSKGYYVKGYCYYEGIFYKKNKNKSLENLKKSKYPKSYYFIATHFNLNKNVLEKYLDLASKNGFTKANMRLGIIMVEKYRNTCDKKYLRKSKKYIQESENKKLKSIISSLNKIEGKCK